MKIIAYLLVSILLASASGAAFACRCVSMDVAENYKSADAVFVGELVRLKRTYQVFAPDGPMRLTPSIEEVEFRVTRTFKGARQKTFKTRTTFSGGNCGKSLEKQAHEKKFLVYAYASENGGYYLSTCSRTSRISGPWAKADLAYLYKNHF